MVRNLSPFMVVIDPSAESALRRLPATFELRLRARLNELATIAAHAPSSLVPGWSPSQQKAPPVLVHFEGRQIRCEVDETRRELRIVDLGAS